MTHMLPRRPVEVPGAWVILAQKYWGLTYREARFWWVALGRAVDRNSIQIRSAIQMYHATEPFLDAEMLLRKHCAPQRIVESLEALVDAKLLRRREATQCEEALFVRLDRRGEWR